MKVAKRAKGRDECEVMGKKAVGNCAARADCRPGAARRCHTARCCRRAGRRGRPGRSLAASLLRAPRPLSFSVPRSSPPARPRSGRRAHARGRGGNGSAGWYDPVLGPRRRGRGGGDADSDGRGRPPVVGAAAGAGARRGRGRAHRRRRGAGAGPSSNHVRRVQLHSGSGRPRRYGRAVRWRAGGRAPSLPLSLHAGGRPMLLLRRCSRRAWRLIYESPLVQRDTRPFFPRDPDPLVVDRLLACMRC